MYAYWYKVAMKTSTGQTIYMGLDSEEKYVWCFDHRDAIAFRDEQDAIDFGKSHFTKFKGWFVKLTSERTD